MKYRLIKKRKHINWNLVRIDLGDFNVNRHYYELKSHSNVSDNRLSYLAFRMVYSKAKLDYYRVTSDVRIFTL